MVVLPYNLQHLTRQFYVWGEEARRSLAWWLKRLTQMEAGVDCYARKWKVHVTLAFSRALLYRAVLAWGL
jgi:hypothetical protein